MDAALARSTGMLRFSRVLVLAAALGGCGEDAAQTPRRAAEPAAPAAVVTAADARLSVATHRGADSLSGLRLQGTCSAGTVRVEVGHAAPYKPLRTVGDRRIDSLRPAKRAALTAPCTAGRFVIRRRQLSVRLGRGALRATPSGGDAVDVRIKRFGIE